MSRQLLRRRAMTAPVVLVMVLTALTACRPAPIPDLPLGDNTGTIDSSSALIDCTQAAQHLVLTTSAHLDPACSYTGGVEITQSGVTLDCRGAHVDTGDGRRNVGILLHTPTSVPLADVTVRNCIVHGFLNGMRVTRDGFKTLVHGHEYDVSDSGITFENDRITDTGGVGLFVDAYVTGVTVDHVAIQNAGSTGIYLEAGSEGSLVEHSTIVGNGFAGTQPPGQLITVGGTNFRYVSTGREGIAVDGSSGNVIRDNVITDNSYGGIFLYKNCGEYATQQPTQWWPRYSGADGNLIEGNVLANEPNGVWLGSRMSENTYFLDCSDPTYVNSGVTTIRLDHAAGNTVSGNTFALVTHGVRVEDDANTITGNRFLGDAASAANPASDAVLIGTKYRTEVLGQPVSGTTVTGNTAQLAGVATPFAWISGQTATTFDGNTNNGQPVTLAAGVQPPINLFLMVASFSVAT